MTNVNDCDKRLSNRFRGIVCDVNADNKIVYYLYDEHYLKVQANCPLDYCQATFDNILENPDEQCANNRSGVICGSCQDNYSIGLGGSKCLQCISNSPLIWLIPVFAVAGVALVALLHARLQYDSFPWNSQWNHIPELKITAGPWPFSVQNCQMANHFPRWLAVWANHYSS